MKVSFKKAILQSFILSFFMIIAYQHPVFAATDLAATVQDLQTDIGNAMHSRLTSYSVNYVSNSASVQADISNAVKNIYNSDDYMAYTSKGYSYSYSTVSGVTTINFSFNYWNTAAMDSYVNSRVSDILSQIITPGMNDYQKEKAIHDWIEANVAYDTTLVKHSDYDALVSPYKTVCQGYALLAYKMLTQVGIQTRILGGYANGVAHAWNEVLLDNVWYQLDTTWDDPIPDVPGRVTYNYYNLTDSQIKANHTWTSTYPVANTLFTDTLSSKIVSDSGNAAFYQDLGNDIGMQYLTADYTAGTPAEISAKVQNAINNNQSSIKIRYMNGSTLAADLKTALFSMSNISTYSYSYSSFLRSPETSDVLVNLSFAYTAPVNVTAISLSQTSLSLAVGGASGTLTATISPSNASNKNVIWTSSDTKVATVLNGVVKPIAGGTATITATSADGSYKAACDVSVTQGITSITLDKTAAYLKVGDPDLTLNTIINPTTATDQRITWSSSNPNVATVDQTGKVHAVSIGTAVITAASTQNPLKYTKCTVTVPTLVTGVSVNKSSLTLKMGTTSTLAPVISPTNATIKTVTWSSSDETIVKVSSAGVLTPVASGTATITVKTTDGGYTGTCAVTVIYGVSSITLDQTSTYLKVGDPDLALKATVNPSNATDPSLTWSSSNINIATVDNNGTVHSIAPGVATITAASVQDPTKVARCTVTVPTLVTGVSVNKSSLTLKMGTTSTISPVFAPTNATIRTVTWSSSDETIVKVSSAGVLTPVAPGTATVTVTSTDGGYTGTCKVTVIYGVSSITLDKTSTYLKFGDPDLTLKATVNPSNATDPSLIWSSSNTNVATVDNNGTVHSVAPGVATITATSVQDPTKVAKCTVTVPILVTGVSVNKNSLTLNMGTTSILTPVIAPTNATIKTVTWSSSNETIVKVSSSGVLTPVAPGTATITVTTTDGGYKGTCAVTVVYGLTSITLDKTSATLKLGGANLVLNPTINPSYATNKALNWVSSNTNVVTVDQNGTVHAVGIGTAVITVNSVQDPTKYTRCSIVVTS
ncbi:MAG: Ig-like domain-containing protein [Bacillota bacterium]|nr:Ig-like domain-containing protein [Bacillota bacterium]